jgi:antitoxin ChpS
MHTTNLRKVGGSVMMAVPPALLDLLHIGAGAKVGLAVDNGRLVVDPQPGPRYTLDELLAQCEGGAGLADDDRTWLDETPTGDELI